MRIWSLHPKYLDTKGLVALWRETLLAQHVLEGKTKGYTHHPQLVRFKALPKPLDGINAYLAEVYKEAKTRGYNFNGDKINWDFDAISLAVTSGQVAYEVNHLQKKLQIRDFDRYTEHLKIPSFELHPLFYLIEGEIEPWEIIS